jgi:hypothetical protein
MTLVNPNLGTDNRKSATRPSALPSSIRWWSLSSQSALSMLRAGVVFSIENLLMVAGLQGFGAKAEFQE